MTSYDIIRNLHILAGTVALAGFWTAATLRKGHGAHPIVGRVFMTAMASVAATGVPLAIFILLRGRPITATVLLYLVVITITPAWLAWRAIRDRGDWKRYTGAVFKGLAVLNLVAGVAVLVVGVRVENLLLMSISLIGVVTGVLMFHGVRREPTDRRWWIVRHYVAIIGAGIATHVTFLNLGLVRLLPEGYGATAQRLSWIVPFAVAIAARIYLDRKYGPKRAVAVPAPVRAN